MILDINPIRVEWTNSMEKSFNYDQFKVDLWMSTETADFTRVQIACQLVACEVNSFNQAVESSMCKLPDDRCTDRYQNLYQNANTKGRVEVERSNTTRVDTSLVFKNYAAIPAISVTLLVSVVLSLKL